MRIAFVFILLAFAAACSRRAQPADGAERIVSLDFCADQYLLALAPEKIAALSPDATRSFSYLREEAEPYRQISPRAEDILALRADTVIRSYGGGPRMTGFLKRAGVRVIEIEYADNLDGVRANILRTAEALGELPRGIGTVAEMDRRLSELPSPEGGKVLYMTSKGAAAGRHTMIDELIMLAGRRNFETRYGWGGLSLEKLAYEHPPIVAVGFFDGPDARTDRWSSARHPVAQQAMKDAARVDIPGAWTACGAWFAVDAVEALAKAGEAQ